MLRSIIIDDEKNCIDVLSRMLTEYCPNVTLLECCYSVDEGIKAIEIHSPELVFLDIEMPNKNGFDLLQQIREMHFEIIFTTAHDKYALQAIKFSALDFLLKPVDGEELRVAVKKAEKRIHGDRLKQKVDTLLYNVNYLNVDKRIVLPTSKGMEFIPIGDIIRCEGENNYTTFYLLDGSKLMVSRTLGDYEELLSDFQFLRVHQSHLINLRHVKNYLRGEGGTITMADLSNVEVSRRKKEEFLKRIAKDLIT